MGYKYSARIEFETNGIYPRDRFLAFLKTAFGVSNVSLGDYQFTPPEPTARERFLRTYSGQELLKQHYVGDIGTWNIYGEDPNCDMGGSHHTPFLETVEGPLSQVIDYAVNLKGFWCWGGGGRIEPAPAIRKLEPKRLGRNI